MDTRVGPAAREAVFAQLAEAGRAEQVAQRLTDAIVLGVLAPGERLPSEPELARRFGVALITVREGLGMLRTGGMLETRRGREGGSFVTTADGDYDAVLGDRLRALSQVEISDSATYFETILAGCAVRAAERAAAEDTRRLLGWLSSADFSSAAAARAQASGFFLELASLSQSPRLVREQIRMQAEFGPLLLTGMDDEGMRSQVARDADLIAHALAGQDAASARAHVSTMIRALSRWLLAARARLETARNADG